MKGVKKSIEASYPNEKVIKDFEKELALINELEGAKNLPIEIKDEEVKATLTKDGIDFILKTDKRDFYDTSTKEIKVQIHNKIYSISKIERTSSTTRTEKGFGVNFLSSYSIYTFHSLFFDRKSIFKSFYPVPKEEIKTFHGTFETITYEINKTLYAHSCVRVEIDQNQFDITQLKNKEKGFFVIEAYSELDIKTFKDYCFAIKQAIGFLNGYFLGGEEYIFTDQKEMYYSNFIRPTIKTHYYPIVTSPHLKKDINKEKADYYHKILSESQTTVSSKILSGFITKIKDNKELSLSVLSIMEATSIRSLLLFPSIFAITIEALSKMISRPKSGVEYLISNKNVEVKIINELLLIIENNSQGLSPESITKLRQRVLSINNPVNKQYLTNNEKLIEPFLQLEIPLSHWDVKVIGHRNDLLHGNIILNKLSEEFDVDSNTYTSYVANRLYTLISRLILKYIGFEGYVYNHAKHMEKYMKIETDEEFFIKV